ncbi:MAG: hypothetical protein RMK73_09630 [Geminicoccaceae bacterium]|nr:hypothetical protein [Geminicoccaceae bacterium]MCS7267099.1 hypothetical protein [Geminicoccaceae bacterium]MDW8124969.1 hypothetical protein [Geminicoccaceae bacterium]MDW8341729.1 hypothetical protein [Geminicoccaceae bacterium]
MSAARRVPSARLFVLLGGLASCTGAGTGEVPTAAVEDATATIGEAIPPAPADGYSSQLWRDQTRGVFVLLDRDRNGRLDFPEIRAGFAALDVDRDGWLSRFEARSLVAIGDRDRDGRLSPRELESLPEFALAADHDEDGTIGAIEFALVRIREFVRADFDRDGRLAPEELARVPDFTLFPF